LSSLGLDEGGVHYNLFGSNKVTNGAFTLDVKSMLNENLGDILGGT
jgi:hypothetical protein